MEELLKQSQIEKKIHLCFIKRVEQREHVVAPQGKTQLRSQRDEDRWAGLTRGSTSTVEAAMAAALAFSASSYVGRDVATL